MDENTSSGFTKIGEDSYRSQGLYVPILREKELAKALKATRAAILEAEVQAQLDAENPTEALQVVEDLFLEADEEVEPSLQASTPESSPTAPETLRVPCVFEEDVLAQQAAAESNSKFSERDRVNAVKGLTKALMARPMTRQIGIPRDVEAAMQRLGDVAPHIPELVSALQIPLLVSRANGAPPMITPILLVGPAGVGKSYVALQIAQILGVPLHTVSYAASGSAGNVLSGGDKSWGNANTGMVFDALTGGDFANPVFCLDEIDKASVSSSTLGVDRHPLNELLALLEPLTAKLHKDRCAEIRVDARHIVWIATANSLEGMSAPLLSRFQLVMVRKPDARAAVTIALSVTQAVSLQMGVMVKQPSGEVLQLLATLTPRTMRRIWTGAAGWCVAGGRDRVTLQDVEHSVGLDTESLNRLH
jgi:ATP-dependent Lon protease